MWQGCFTGGLMGESRRIWQGCFQQGCFSGYTLRRKHGAPLVPAYMSAGACEPVLVSMPHRQPAR